MPQYSDAIGIDFGTVRSYVGVWNLDSQKAEILKTDAGNLNEEFPSYVHFKRDGNHIAGHEAKEKFSDPNTLSHARCLLGHNFTLENAKKLLPKDIPFKLDYDITDGLQYIYSTQTDDSGLEEPVEVTVTPARITTIILKELKEIARRYTNRAISKLAITVPARSGSNQREAFQKAAEDAGFGTVDIYILEDPTASAIAYATQGTASPGKLLVFDLGNSSLDIAILAFTNGQGHVQANESSPVGGAIFDEDILTLVNDKYKAITSEDLNAAMKTKLRLLCAEAKKTLDSASKATIQVGEKDIDVTLEEFNVILNRHIPTMRAALSKVLLSAKIDDRGISRVLLVGGSSRIRQIRDLVTGIFGAEKLVSSDIGADLTVVYGATMHAAHKADDLEDMNSPADYVEPVGESVGLRLARGVMSKIILKGSMFPVSVTKMISTSRDDQELLSIRVYQGEDERAANNELIGNFNVTGIPKGPRGKVRILITYAINNNGIVEVSATDDQKADRGKITCMLVNRDGM